MKTSELIGVALDYAVGVALGHDMTKAVNYGPYLRIPAFKDSAHTTTFSPSGDWTIAGPLIERECVSVTPTGKGHEPWAAEGPEHEVWSGIVTATNRHTGPTPLIAAMRCFVASKLGEEVVVPQEFSE